MSKTVSIDLRLPKDTLAYYEVISEMSGVKVGKVIAVVLAMRTVDMAVEKDIEQTTYIQVEEVANEHV